MLRSFIGPNGSEPTDNSVRRYFTDTALLPDGWSEDVMITVDRAGDILSVDVGARSGPDAERLGGPVVPGVPNLHSHAFQRGMAGLAERSSESTDSFWSWREVMYAFLQTLDPDDVENIATWLYLEMLMAGYTSVSEFHYLHHDPSGRPHARASEMSDRIGRAASRAGIGLTHLPVLYESGGFGGTPPGDAQRRFVQSVDDYLALVEAVQASWSDDPDRRVGIAFHSLRAVSLDSMSTVLEARSGADGDEPVHIHVAEQQAEVSDCVEWSGARPVALLLDRMPVSERWCLVHATHVERGEWTELARSGAVVGLCPSTEANLGDGLFPLPEFLDSGGTFGVGSDSHVCVDPAEELRWLEYGQRLFHRRRNVVRAPGTTSTGTALLSRAVHGGARASGRPIGGIAPGLRADLVVLDGAGPSLAARRASRIADSWILTSSPGAVKDVMVGGRWVVQGGRHALAESAAVAFHSTMEKLAGKL